MHETESQVGRQAVVLCNCGAFRVAACVSCGAPLCRRHALVTRKGFACRACQTEVEAESSPLFGELGD